MTYADVSDIERELGRPPASAAQSDQWSAWLERVERTIVRRFTRVGLVLADQIVLNNPSEADVKDIEVAAVIRKIENPNGITSVTRTLDDGSLTTRREGAADAGLALLGSEWDLLLPFGDRSAFSTRPSFEPDCFVSVYPAGWPWT